MLYVLWGLNRIIYKQSGYLNTWVIEIGATIEGFGLEVMVY